jgi:hypothetical protein
MTQRSAVSCAVSSADRASLSRIAVLPCGRSRCFHLITGWQAAQREAPQGDAAFLPEARLDDDRALDALLDDIDLERMAATVVVRSTWDASALTDSLIQRRPQRSLPKSHFCNFPLLLNSGKCRKLAPNRADRARRPDAIESGAFKKVPSGRTLCLFLSCKALPSISARSMP